MNNMELWDRVRTPDPDHTKRFTRAGGFSGTATNTQYLFQMATQVFGPNGFGWGFEITGENYVPGSTLANGDKTIVHVIRGRVWYLLEGQKYYTSEQFGQTTFVGEHMKSASSDRNAEKVPVTYTDEEAPKKSVTDCMSKCLSLLGFAADTRLGLWDDHKYINSVRERFKQDGGTPPPDEPPACTTAQVEEIEREAKALNVNMEGFLKNLGITGLHLLTPPSYEKAKKLLAWKRQSNGGETNGNHRN